MPSAASLRIVLIVATVASCAGGPKVVDDVDPFNIPREDFRRTTKIVGLADVQIPDGMPEPELISDNFRGLIEDRLRGAGYTLVTPQQYKTIWQSFEEQTGGFIDVETGERDHRAIALAMTGTLKQLDAGIALDAILIPTVVVVEAPFGGGRAVWHDTWQPIKTGSVVKGFFAGSPEGTMGALSLKLTAVDTDGVTLYEKSGGIEVLSKLFGKEFVLVPRDELFTNQGRIEKAVRIVVDPLLD